MSHPNNLPLTAGPPRTSARMPVKDGSESSSAAEQVATASLAIASDAVSQATEVQRDRLGYARLEQRVIALASQWFEPAARIAIFIVYFWFGLLKAIGVSPATPLATALTAHTIGLQYFNTSFKALAVFEMGLGILFLIPQLTRPAVVLLIVHLGIVSSPLVIVASVAWTHPLVPTLEGQYIIKDLVILALGIGILAHWGSPGARRAARVGPSNP